MKLFRSGWPLAALLGLTLVAGCGTEPSSTSETAAQPAAPPAPPPPPETSLGRLVKAERIAKAPLSVVCQQRERGANYMLLTDAAEFESGSLEFAESLSQPPFLGAVKDRRSRKGEEVFRLQTIGGGKRAYLTDPGVEVLNSNPDKFGLGLCTVDGSAKTGKVFVVLSFEGQRTRPVNDAGGLSKMMRFQAFSTANFLARVEGRSWLADDAGTKYTRPGVVAGTEKTQLAFEVPAGAKGLAWHDGKEKTYGLEPYPKEIRE